MLAGNLTANTMLGSRGPKTCGLPSKLPLWHRAHRSHVLVVHAQQDDPSSTGGAEPVDPAPEAPPASPEQPQQPQPPSRRRRRRQRQPKEAGPFVLEDLNPVSMGRKSRAIFDGVWAQLQRIGGPTRTVELDDDTYQLAAPEEFQSPQAPDTTVLVTGATGRVGRVLVRKLLLRGYKVRALVRRRDGVDLSAAIPQSVEVITGDVGDYAACRKAVEGADKVICCSAARTSITADLNRVEQDGVANLARAFMDARNAAARRAGTVAPNAKVDIADFKREEYHPLWDIEHVGPPVGRLGEVASKGYFAQRRQAQRSRDAADAYISETDALVFTGAIYSRDGFAEVGAPMQLPHGGSLAGCDGLVMRLLGDGHTYTACVETADGATFTSKFATRPGYATIRVPFTSFTPIRDDDGTLQLDPAAISRLKLRFEPRVKQLEQVTAAGGTFFDSEDNEFKLEVDWIKALPGGVETDFILVSCAGTRRADVSPEDRDKILAAKRRGEAWLRNCGLGYTVVRPGPLIEEAGGYRALVFDQGNRITQSISCADVADVCLKGLHDPLARNKTFEVCWEYTPEEGLESYELVAHLPDKANSYLSPALATLQRNT